MIMTVGKMASFTLRLPFTLGLSKFTNIISRQHGQRIWTRTFLTQAAPVFSVLPEIGFMDGHMDISASGLQPGQRVALRARVRSECGRFGFESQGHYEADADGRLSVNTQPSLGGTYTGIEPMGLLWSMLPDEVSVRKLARLVKIEPTVHQWVYTFDLFDGINGDTREAEVAIDSKVVNRIFLSPNVEMTSVKCGSAVGMLYMPREDAVPGPLPLIIDLPGLSPRSVQDRAPLLASHGFAVFDLDYLSPVRDELESIGYSICIDSKMFYDVLDFARNHPRLDADRVGLSGACYGGTIALFATSLLADLPVRCAVMQRIYDALLFSGFRLSDGSPIILPWHPDDFTTTEVREDGRSWITYKRDHRVFDETTRGSYIAQVEGISCPLLFLVCEGDTIPTERCMMRAAHRLEEAGKGHLLDYTSLPGAGHLLEAPYVPLCPQSRLYLPHFTDVTYIQWGGDQLLHAKAQETAWRKTINFFRTHLGPMAMLRNDWVDEDLA
ncbi:bile acid-CoA:amino acid N-acyltransferase-like [Diadema antillarum]|uniref:bile acid-CoA:amino acid N-acyltransferase-like n=1 Tax=Diadema antillarum TaxID=105358 RepID=UPI003A890489